MGTKKKYVTLKEGDHVKFTNDKSKQGIVRFIGKTEFENGIVYGIEMTTGMGDCDGSIDNVSYFQTSDGNSHSAMFVKRKLLRRIKPKNKNKQKRKTKHSFK